MYLKEGNLGDPRVLELIRIHLETAHCNTARGSAHALDADGLKAPGIDVWTAWDGEELVGIGALKRISPAHAEVKSMHVACARRRQGAGSILLRHLIAMAREKGVRRLSLETGSRDYFAPARALYRAYGFSECGQFAGYAPDANSVFMSMELSADPDRTSKWGPSSGPE